MAFLRDLYFQNSDKRTYGPRFLARAKAKPPLDYLPFSFKNVPFSSSLNASRNCSCVFITIGPYHATGSSNGLPETSRNRMPSSPACTVTSSPLSKRISERFSAVEGGAVSSQFTLSV